MHVRNFRTKRVAATIVAAAMTAGIVGGRLLAAAGGQAPTASTQSSTQSATTSAPAATRTTIDVSKLGPQVGEQVPDFSLADQNGKVWTRDSIMGPKGAMLVFIRSADW